MTQKDFIKMFGALTILMIIVLAIGALAPAKYIPLKGAENIQITEYMCDSGM